MVRCFATRCTLAAAIVTGCTTANAFAAVDVPDDFVNETLITGLDQPLSMSFLPDGRMLFVEQRTAKVRMMVNGHLATTDPILTVPNVVITGSEQGLQGIAVDPAWPTRPYVYLFHNRSGNCLRLVRYTASGSLTDPNSSSLSLSSPLLLIDNFPDAATNHNGGTLRFGPDGNLYLSIGEDADECAAQDSTKLKGNILRMRIDLLPAGGGGPVAKALLIPQNPALASPDSNAKLVYAYGLRNPWRFQIDPSTGLVYVADVGDATWEEFDEVRPGNNLGWPLREGNAMHSDPGCTEPGGAGHGKYLAPIATLNHSTGAAAILAAGVYRRVPNGDDNWPLSYEGSAFYSDYYMGVLRRMTKSGSTWSAAAAVPGQPNSSDWAAGLTSPVDFQVGPDGSLYWISQFDANRSAVTGSISRIRSTVAPVNAVPDGPAPSLALAVSPNPFVALAHVTLSLPAATRVKVTVFDVRGRAVRSLFDAKSEAGPIAIAWDGNDEHGKPVAPGVYYVTARQGGVTETVRLLRLR